MKKLLGFFAVVFAAFSLMACAPKTATVTLDVNGGDALTQTEYVLTVGQPANLPTPTRTGYDFGGWNRSDDGSTPDLAEWTLEGTYTLIAQWTAKTCVINLDVAGGDALASDVFTVSYNAYVSGLPTPTRTGYDFLYWQDASGNEVNGLTKWTTLTESTLTAVWSGKMVSYVLNAGAGATVNGQATQNGQFFMGGTISNLPVAVKAGYNFVGWQYNNAALGTTWEVWSEVPVTLTPNFVAKTYTLTLNVGEGEGDATYEVTFDGAYELPTPTAPEFKEFSHWEMNGEPVAKFGDAWTYAEPTELVAVYERTHFFLTFVQEGQQPIVKPVELGSALDVVPAITPVDGYMVEWTINGTVAASDDDIKALTEDTSISVLKTAKTYTVNFNAGEGAITEGEASMQIVFASEPTLPVAAQVGYTFQGWALAGSEVVISGAWNLHEADGIIDLVAVYTANTYTVTYVVDEFTAIASSTLTVTFGKEYTLDTNVTCEHANFIKWETVDGVEFANSGTWNIADNVTLYPVLDGKNFDVKYVVDGQETVKSLKYGASITETFGVAPTKGAHIFDGWIIDGKFYDKDAKSDVIANGKVITAHFIPDNNYGPAV